MAAKKRMLSIKEKMDIINVLENEKLTVREIARRFNIGKSQAAGINKNRDSIRTKWESGVNVHQKRSFVKKGGSDIDRSCLDWFLTACNQNIPVSGPLIKAKAREIAFELGLTNFIASDGWLYRWRIRNNVDFNCISGEAPDARDYKPADIYTADESLSDVELVASIPGTTSEIFKEEITLSNGFEFITMGESIFTEGIQLQTQNSTTDICESDKTTAAEISDPITSFDEAMKQIARLKHFAKNDYIAFYHIKSIETYFESQNLKSDRFQSKQPTITKYFQRKKIKESS